MKNEYEKSGGDSLDILYDNSEKVIDFQLNNEKLLTEYRNSLAQRNAIVKDFNDKKQELEDLEKQREEVKTQSEKKTLDAQIANAKKAKEQYYDKILDNQTKADESYKKLMQVVGNDSDLQKFMSDNFSSYDSEPFFKTSSEHIDRLKDSFSDFYEEIKKLDAEFEKGNISAQQYFNGLNNYINKLDLSNANQDLDKLRQNISGLFGNNISYLDNFVGTLFEDKIADAEDVKNLQAYTSNLSSLIDMLKKGNAEGGAFEGQISNAIFAGDGKTDSQRKEEIKQIQEQIAQKQQEAIELQTQKAALETKEYSGTFSGSKGGNHSYKYTKANGAYDVTDYKGNVMPNSGFAGSASRDKAEDLGYKQYESDVADLDKKIKDATDSQENLNQQIKDLEAGDGLDEYQSQLKEIGEVLEDMDIEKTQDAFDTLAEGIENGAISNIVTSLDKLPAKYRSAFLEVSNDIVYALGSSSEEVRKQAEQSLEALIGTESEMMLQTVDFSNLTAEQVTQMSTEIANKAIIAQGGVTDALKEFATQNNKIASTAMGQAVQTLGLMLGDVGEALGQIDISIPVKIPKIQLHIADFLTGGDLIQMPDQTESTIQLGGSGSVVKGFDSLKSALTNADYADALGKLMGDGSGNGKFNPYSFNPTGKKEPSGKKKSGSGSGSNYSAEDAASDLKDILNDIEDYEADIELDLEDQTEELINHYNLEKNKLETLKEELDYYESIYDSTENTTKWLETQNKLLANQSKSVEELQKSNDKIVKQREKIYNENSGYNVRSWFDSEGNETLAYGDMLNSFEYQINAIEKETAQKMRDVYNGVAGSTSKDAISAAKDKIKQIEEEADVRIKKIEKEKEKIENIYDSVSQLNDAWKENEEAIRDALSEMHDRVKDIRDTLTDQLMEQLEKAVDRQNESIEKDATRMEQLVSIREKYYDILNETLDTQAELDSELQSSLDSFEYLDEQMRQLMFNEDDYKVLSETLTGIQEDIAGIWEDHYAQIDSLTDDEMYKAEYITAETERQLDMKMKEYELAKAELDVAKARTNLQNVQNERNVRMFVGGQWIWTADPNAVKDAQQQLADAEREKNKIEREAEQKNLIDKMNKIIDSDNLQIDENNELLERVQEAIEAQTVEVQSIEQALQNITDENLPMMGTVLEGAFGVDGKSGSIAQLLTNINKSTSGLTLALKGYTVASAENALKNGSLSKSDFEDLVSKLGYSFNETTGVVTTPEGSFNAHYKGWTKKSNNDIQLGTAANGVQVTGGGASSSSNTSSGGSNANGFPRTGHVSTSSLPLRIRSGAGTNYKVLGLMPKGAAVTITGEANSGWAKVSYNGISGYASRQYLTYDQGGLAMGKGMFLKDINVPERVLSPQQTKSFDTLVKNLTTNPVLAALTKNTKGTSNLNGLSKGFGETKQYYFSNFTVQADNITEFIDSLEGMVPITK